jgi:GntR family transcriptional repressor for pyruvate dehydrogenase complex
MNVKTGRDCIPKRMNPIPKAPKGTATFSSLKLQRQKLSEEITEVIQEMVRSGTLKVGDRLPAERRLSALLKVNRSTVREAIRLLRERGLIERNNGRRTRIVNIPPAQVGAAIERYFVLNNFRHQHLQELRGVLEPFVASLAAANAEPGDLAKLAESLTKLEESWQSKDFQALAAADAAFHVDLARASHNPLIVAIFSGLSSVFERFLSLEHPRFRREESFRTHREIYEAVAAGDSAKAEGAMRRGMMTTPVLD